jgi:hypothetical protein
MALSLTGCRNHAMDLFWRRLRPIMTLVAAAVGKLVFLGFLGFLLALPDVAVVVAAAGAPPELTVDAGAVEADESAPAAAAADNDVDGAEPPAEAALLGVDEAPLGDFFLPRTTTPLGSSLPRDGGGPPEAGTTTLPPVDAALLLLLETPSLRVSLGFFALGLDATEETSEPPEAAAAPLLLSTPDGTCFPGLAGLTGTTTPSSTSMEVAAPSSVVVALPAPPPPPACGLDAFSPPPPSDNFSLSLGCCCCCCDTEVVGVPEAAEEAAAATFAEDMGDDDADDAFIFSLSLTFFLVGEGSDDDDAAAVPSDDDEGLAGGGMASSFTLIAALFLPPPPFVMLPTRILTFLLVAAEVDATEDADDMDADDDIRSRLCRSRCATFSMSLANLAIHAVAG